MSRFRAGAVAAAACGATLVMSPPAIAVDFGIHTQSFVTSSDTARMAAGGARTMRLLFHWGKVERAPDYAYDWRGYDLFMENAAASGVKLLPIVAGTPRWAKHTDEAWPEGRRGLQHYRRFLKALVKRYGREGEFWRQHPSLPYLPMTAYQVWNEPNLKYFSPGGRTDARDYAELLKVSDRVIGQKDPKAKIVLAGMPEHHGLPTPFKPFLRRLFKQPGIQKIADVVAIHPYGSTSEKVLEGALPRMLRAVRAAAGRKQEIWITELGWATGGNTRPVFTKSTNEHAWHLYQAMRGIESIGAQHNIERAIVFSWRDRVPQSPTGAWQSQTGLFYKDGTKKPAWDAFAHVTGGVPGDAPISESPPPRRPPATEPAPPEPPPEEPPPSS
jgi:hypothetical protein